MPDLEKYRKRLKEIKSKHRIPERKKKKKESPKEPKPLDSSELSTWDKVKEEVKPEYLSLYMSDLPRPQPKSMDDLIENLDYTKDFAFDNSLPALEDKAITLLASAIRMGTIEGILEAMKDRKSPVLDRLGLADDYESAVDSVDDFISDDDMEDDIAIEDDDEPEFVNCVIQYAETTPDAEENLDEEFSKLSEGAKRQAISYIRKYRAGLFKGDNDVKEEGSDIPPE